MSPTSPTESKASRGEPLSEPVHMRIHRADKRALDKIYMDIRQTLPFDKQDILREAIAFGLPVVADKYRNLIETINANNTNHKR